GTRDDETPLSPSSFHPEIPLRQPEILCVSLPSSRVVLAARQILPAIESSTFQSPVAPLLASACTAMASRAPKGGSRKRLVINLESPPPPLSSVPLARPPEAAAPTPCFAPPACPLQAAVPPPPYAPWLPGSGARNLGGQSTSAAVPPPPYAPW
ncbi:unnamed protein product, partial [Urochloa humidicola]